MKQRIDWIDVAKCLGIFAIYWCHYGVADEKVGQFTSHFHIQLFFLLSGCLEACSETFGICNSLKKTFRGILVPWSFFAVASLIIHALDQNYGFDPMVPLVIQAIRGTMRNHFVAFGLWFLTCMACTKMLFSVIRKLQSRFLIIMTCTVLYVVAWLKVNTSMPGLYYNADLALHYVFYYGIGFCAYPIIDRFMNPQKTWQKILVGMCFCLAAGFSAFLYFGINLYDVFFWGALETLVKPVITTLTVIVFVLLLAGIFRDAEALQSVGRNSLYLCGSEYPVRVIVATILNSLGLGLQLSSPLASFLLCVGTLWYASKYLVPIEKCIVAKMLSALDILKIKTK